MKKGKLISILFFTSIFLFAGAAVGYYALLRPYENISPGKQILFEKIEPVDNIAYPVSVMDVDSLIAKINIEKGISISMEDGVNLSANIFRPKAAGKYPVVMSFTAYDKDKGPTEYPDVLNAAYLPDFNLGAFQVSPWTLWEGPDPAFWVSHNYVVVHVDSRGFFDSDGNASLFDEQNTADFHAIINWAGTQNWSNGNVGLNGVSYLAISQWVAASNDPPSYLKAIIPWEGATDSYREILFHGGIPETVFTRFWVNRVRNCANEVKPLPPFSLFQLGHKNPWLLQKIQKPPNFKLNTIQVPALVCGSWSDHGLHTRGSFEGFKQISSEKKWLFTHGRPKWSTYYSEEALDFQKDFFDYFLKEMDNGFDTVKAVRLEIRESLDKYYVRYENSFPIERTRYQKLYLDGGTNTLKERLENQVDTVEYESLKDKATFTHHFKKDTELSGNMKLKLWVSTNQGADMDLFVAIKKIDAAGKDVHFYAKTGYTKGPVAMGWLRVSERELDSDKSTNWQPVLTHKRPQKISKNEIIPVEIEILPSSTLFKQGESLELVIQGKDFFIHPSLGHYYSTNQGEHSIFTGVNYDSHLLIPVIPKKKKESRPL